MERASGGEALRSFIRKHPQMACRQVFGEEPWPLAAAMMRSVFASTHTAVRGCTGSSKTYWMARTAFLWLLGHAPRGRVFTLAPSARQVSTNLWKEVRDAYAKGGGQARMGGRLYKQPRYELDAERAPDCYMQGFTTDDPSFLHGIHGEADLIIVDDAHAVPQETYAELENVFAGGKTHIALLYNPMELSGETYDCVHRHAAQWSNIQIPFALTPNGAAGRDVVPQMLTNATAERWREKYGADSNFCRVKVDAEFPTQGADTLIPMAWVEAAMKRKPHGSGGWRHVGVDVARFGDDETVLTTLHGPDCLEQEVRAGQDTQATADDAERLLKVQRDASTAWVDDIGVGGGVTDALARRRCPVQAVCSSGRPTTERHSDGRDAAEAFDTVHSLMWWLVREALDPEGREPLTLPPSDELLAQLSSVKYKLTGGRICVEASKDMKRRLGRSPDHAVSLCLAVYGRAVGTSADELARHLRARQGEGEARRDGSSFAEAALGGSETIAGLGEFRG